MAVIMETAKIELSLRPRVALRFFGRKGIKPHGRSLGERGHCWWKYLQAVKGLPYMTSAQRGGQKIPQISGQTVHRNRTKGRRVSKNPKNLRTSYMEAP